ncbi:MAG: hypothetical protein K0U45_09450 [Alphaproteobacteria bacterium]|nr:hypothetical protein [Alphaproteobacteria bacterium]
MSNKNTGLTLYLDGNANHNGNVTFDSFIDKARELQVLLERLERAYNKTTQTNTVFEIVDAKKVNPTSFSIAPTPKLQDYDPVPAFMWGIEQTQNIANGKPTDARITKTIAKSFIAIATKKENAGYRKCWINGSFDPIEFDDSFLENAKKLAIEKDDALTNKQWYKGTSTGSITGELRAVNDIKKDFIIVPHYGAQNVKCIFDENIKNQIPDCLFKNVNVSGVIFYEKDSPFPKSVNATDIKLIPDDKNKKHLINMKGIFKGYEKPQIDWNELLDE